MARRVFISYSHEDRALAGKIHRVIGELGFEPLWDEEFSGGQPFGDQIRDAIAHAHVFLPVLTESSSGRGWVHQEIGYAAALRIPVLPVSWGKLPKEMISELHAISLREVEADHEDELRRKITPSTLDALVAKHMDSGYASYESAEYSENRALLMKKYADHAKHLGQIALLRQKGGLSSLHIPAEVPSDEVWAKRYGGRSIAEFHIICQREEREALAFHAEQAGFRLIIYPGFTYEIYGVAARIVRLKTLISFLRKSEDGPKCQVACGSGDGPGGSITILGDWFYSQSISASLEKGYRQTIFSRHAPSMQAKIELFDQEFEGILDHLGWTPEDSKEQAILLLEKIVADLESPDTGP